LRPPAARDRFPISMSGAPLEKKQSIASKRMRVQLAFVALACAVLYAPVCLTIFQTWQGIPGRDDYSHGYFVVLAALYLVWRQRKKLAGLEVLPNFALGVPIMLMAAAVLLAGKLSATAVLEQFSLVAMLTGLVLLLGGSRFFKALALPLYFLAFAFPLFDEVTASVDWYLQLLAAHNAASLLRIVGIPVHRAGQYLHLPGLTLEVAEACSGARYVISVIALTVPLAYLTLPTWRRRIALVCFAATVGVMANGVRVALIGIGVEYMGAGIAGRPIHTLQGLFVYWIGIGVIFAAIWLLRRWPKACPCPVAVSRGASRATAPGVSRGISPERP